MEARDALLELAMEIVDAATEEELSTHVEVTFEGPDAHRILQKANWLLDKFGPKTATPTA